MKYMLITVVNREISTELFNFYENAKKRMEKEFNEATADKERVDGCGICAYSAWANVDAKTFYDYEYDWSIVII